MHTAVDMSFDLEYNEGSFKGTGTTIAAGTCTTLVPNETPAPQETQDCPQILFHKNLTYKCTPSQ